MKYLQSNEFLPKFAPVMVALLLLVLMCIIFSGAVQAGDQCGSGKLPGLDKRIKPFDKKDLQKLNASEENPFITIYDDKVTVSWNKGKQNKETKPEAVPKVLSEIPVSAWPYGRVVGMTYCGITSFSKETWSFKQKAWKTIEASLKRMKIYLNPWPCA